MLHVVEYGFGGKLLLDAHIGEYIWKGFELKSI